MDGLYIRNGIKRNRTDVIWRRRLRNDYHNLTGCSSGSSIFVKCYNVPFLS